MSPLCGLLGLGCAWIQRAHTWGSRQARPGALTQQPPASPGGGRPPPHLTSHSLSHLPRALQAGHSLGQKAWPQGSWPTTRLRGATASAH